MLMSRQARTVVNRGLVAKSPRPSLWYGGWQRRDRVRWTPFVLILPAALFVSLVLIYPLVQTVFTSFTTWSFADPSTREIVGFDNYRKLFTPGSEFLDSLGMTVKFTGLVIFFELVLGLGGALLLERITRGRSFFSSIAIMPFMMAILAVGLVWRTLFDYQYGLVNYFGGLLGLPPINWLADSTPALIALVIAETWATAPFVMLLILAGLVGIPNEVLEAAAMDGAGRVKVFWHIKLPLVMPAITIALIFQTVLALRLFALSYSLTRGGPGVSTTPVGLLIQRTFFTYFDGGAAAAMSVVLCLLGAIVSLVYLRLFYRESRG